MKYSRWLYVISFCCSSVFANEQPDWLTGMIEDVSHATVANPPVEISQYQLDGKTVYYIPGRCCDVPSSLYDAQGQLICQPDGGFTGRGDGRCPGVFEQLQEGSVIWKDPR